MVGQGGCPPATSSQPSTFPPKEGKWAATVGYPRITHPGCLREELVLHGAGITTRSWFAPRGVRSVRQLAPPPSTPVVGHAIHGGQIGQLRGRLPHLPIWPFHPASAAWANRRIPVEKRLSTGVSSPRLPEKGQPRRSPPQLQRSPWAPSQPSPPTRPRGRR